MNIEWRPLRDMLAVFLLIFFFFLLFNLISHNNFNFPFLKQIACQSGVCLWTLHREESADVTDFATSWMKHLKHAR